LFIASALVWLITSILAVLLIVGSYVWVAIYDQGSGPDSPLYSGSLRTSALQRMSPEDASRFFREFDKMGENETYIYQPWVGFSERPYHSPLLNVDDGDPLPCRRTVQSTLPGPVKRVIWLFGGSTQFGWGVPDAQTVTSHLAAIVAKLQPGIRYEFINEGHSYYYSSQEEALFLTLLRRGYRCDGAIFLDGLNETTDYALGVQTAFTARAATAFLKEQSENPSRRRSFIITPFFPPVRMLSRLLGRSGAALAIPGGPKSGTYDRIAKYRMNMLAIERLAEAANVKVAFFWQPTPFDYLAEAEQNRKPYVRSRIIPGLNARARSEITDPSFHFIADALMGRKYEQMYVDITHYGDEGSRVVADVIARNLAGAGMGW
jgi:hypothetical protein